MTWKFEPPIIAGPYSTLWPTMEQRIRVQRVAWMRAGPWTFWPELYLAEISPVDSETET